LKTYRNSRFLAMIRIAFNVSSYVKARNLVNAGITEEEILKMGFLDMRNKSMEGLSEAASYAAGCYDVKRKYPGIIYLSMLDKRGA
jgi:hypothetical protein